MTPRQAALPSQNERHAANETVAGGTTSSPAARKPSLCEKLEDGLEKLDGRVALRYVCHGTDVDRHAVRLAVVVK